MRGGPPALAGTREYKQSDRGRYQAEGVKVLWNLEYPVGVGQKEICAHFNEGNWAQFGRSAKRVNISD